MLFIGIIWVVLLISLGPCLILWAICRCYTLYTFHHALDCGLVIELWLKSFSIIDALKLMWSVYYCLIILFPLAQYHFWSKVYHFFIFVVFCDAFLRISFWRKRPFLFVWASRLFISVAFLIFVVADNFRQICALNSIISVQNGNFILLLFLYFVKKTTIFRRCVTTRWKVPFISKLTSRIIIYFSLFYYFVSIENGLLLLFFNTMFDYYISHFFLCLLSIQRLSGNWSWTCRVLYGPLLFSWFSLIRGLWIRISNWIVSFWALGSFLFYQFLDKLKITFVFRYVLFLIHFVLVIFYFAAGLALFSLFDSFDRFLFQNVLKTGKSFDFGRLVMPIILNWWLQGRKFLLLQQFKINVSFQSILLFVGSSDLRGIILPRRSSENSQI